jgi:hypothetical protein
MKPRNRLVAIREDEYLKLLYDIERLSHVSSFTFTVSIINSALIIGLFLMMIVN